MTNLNEILQNKIRLYDQENGTELARFVAFLEREKVYEENIIIQNHKRKVVGQFDLRHPADTLPTT